MLFCCQKVGRGVKLLFFWFLPESLFAAVMATGVGGRGKKKRRRGHFFWPKWPWRLPGGQGGIQIKIFKSLLASALISASVERFGVSCMLDLFHILRKSIGESLN